MKKLNTVIAAMTLAAAGGANAAMVTSWSYENEAGFTDVSPDSITLLQPQPANVLSQNTDLELAWGEPIINNLSSNLTVDSPKTGILTTVSHEDALEASDFVEGTSLTHENYPINGDTLSGATLLDGLSLSIATWDLAAPVPAVGAFSGPELNIAFDFFETSNIPVNNMCLDGSVAGTDPNLPGFGCDDYFIISDDFVNSISNLVIDQLTNTLQFSVMFDLLDQAPAEFAAFAEANDLITTYELTTQLVGLEITTDFCGNQPAPCLALRTPENETSMLAAPFAIQAVNRVSAPATVALLGLGLLGLARHSRRRKA